MSELQALIEKCRDLTPYGVARQLTSAGYARHDDPLDMAEIKVEAKRMFWEQFNKALDANLVDVSEISNQLARRYEVAAQQDNRSADHE